VTSQKALTHLSPGAAAAGLGEGRLLGRWWLKRERRGFQKTGGGSEAGCEGDVW